MEVGEIVLGRYDLVEEIGKGSSSVFKAYDRRVRREVAIKRLRLDSDAVREARALGRLNHPNIVTLYDVIEDGSWSYLVMEYVDGETLLEILASGPIQPAASAAIASEICRALEAAHKNGIVHLDVKPANVLVSREGRVKVADFGIAALLGGRGIGRATLAYASPEQLTGGVVDEKSDIFSLGCVLYEMLTGKSPFMAATGSGSVKKVLEYRPPAPDELARIPRGLGQVVMMAIEKDRESRYGSASEFRGELEVFAGEESIADLLRLRRRPPSSLLRQIVDFFSASSSVAQRALPAVLAAGAGLALFDRAASISMAIAFGITSALRPDIGMGFVLIAAFYKILEFSSGLAVIIAPLCLAYFFLGRRHPTAALSPAVAAYLFSIGLSPVYPILGGIFLAPLAALLAGFAGGLIDGSLFLFAGELGGLKGVSNPIVVALSLARTLERSPGLLLQPILWSIVAAGLSSLRRLGAAPWLAAAVAFTVEAAGYYWLAGTYAAMPVQDVMRRLAFSLIIILLLAIIAPGMSGGPIDESDKRT